MIRRLNATVVVDLRRQIAEGFWLMALLVTFLLAAVLRAFHIDWAVWWPVVLLAELTITAFYFAAIHVLMQRSEGTLAAQVTSPLRPWEYLLALVVALVVLSLAEMSLLALLGIGWHLNWAAYLAAVGFTATLYVLYGSVAVSGYSSISEFLLPSGAWTAVFAIPMLPLFGVPSGWWQWLHPLQPAVALTQIAFGQLDAWWALPSLVAAVLWAVLGFKLATSRFGAFMAGGE